MIRYGYRSWVGLGWSAFRGRMGDVGDGLDRGGGLCGCGRSARIGGESGERRWCAGGFWVEGWASTAMG